MIIAVIRICETGVGINVACIEPASLYIAIGNSYNRIIVVEYFVAAVPENTIGGADVARCRWFDIVEVVAGYGATTECRIVNKGAVEQMRAGPVPIIHRSAVPAAGVSSEKAVIKQGAALEIVNCAAGGAGGVCSEYTLG